MHKPLRFHLFRLLLLLLTTLPLHSQQQVSSVLNTSENYTNNPKQYLSKLDSTKIKTSILIDRVLYDDLIENTNGKDKVTTINCTDWAKLYTIIKQTMYQPKKLEPLSQLEELATHYDHYKHIQLLGLLDYTYNKIGPSSKNKPYTEHKGYLNPKNINYLTGRTIALSALTHNISGDNITYQLSKLTHYTNTKYETLQTIEIDFNNGEGYKSVQPNKPITIHYGPKSSYIELKTKLTYTNNTTNKESTYYSHSTLYRTGSNTVPPPSITDPSSTLRTDDNGLYTKPSPPITQTKYYYYPEGTPQNKLFCLSGHCEYLTDIVGRKIEYNILLSPKNTSGKLRKPFIISDGFDPGNKRNYDKNNISINNDMPKDNDTRGLYQLLNGDPSPWYPDRKSANLITLLRNDGYDIIIVNYLLGDGDIIYNGEALRDFLKNIINSPKYRDEKTEGTILVGPSMGGLVTRYALTTMEKNNEDHQVKTWISFDSPHKGAYIPLALQHAMDFFNNKNDDATNAMYKLNSQAAQQMLLVHYKQTMPYVNSKGDLLYTTGPLSYFTTLYNKLDALGYPKQSKNYAITNGGTSKLYPTDASQIIDFQLGKLPASAIGYGLGPEKHTIFYGTITLGGTILDFLTGNLYMILSSSKRISDQIPYENNPGGWNSALYSLNCQPTNNWRKDENKESDKPYVKATFIPTPSAFGITPTKENIAKTWEYYNTIPTPFDVIKGMKGENQEHVTITPETASDLMDILHKDFNNSSIPMSREGKSTNRTITGSETNTGVNITLGGNGNTLTITSGSNVTITASNQIRLLPGTTIKAGSTFRASINPNINYTTTNKTEKIPETQSVDYNLPSPYRYQVHNYQDENNPITQLPTQLKIYPNPAENELNIELTDVSPVSKIEIINQLGQIIYQNAMLANGLNTLDLSNIPGWTTGLYYIKVTYNKTNIQTTKIIKR